MTAANVPKLSVRYKNHPTLFMKSGFIDVYEQLKGTATTSSRRPKPTASAISPFSGGISGDVLQNLFNVRNMTDLDTVLSYFIESLDSRELDLKESYEYAMTLPESYWGAGSFSKWIRVGWALRNISDKLFVVWVRFSAQAADFNFSCIRDDLWDRWTKFDLRNPNGLTKRSIMHWAKKDNLNGYQKVRHQSVDYYIDQTIKSITIDTVSNDRMIRGCGDYDIAKVLYQLFKDEYVCASVKAGIWYRYKNHRWAEIDSGTTLRNAISEEIRTLYMNKIMILQAREVSGTVEINEEQKKTNQAIITKIGEICSRLGRTNDKKNIMTEARELFYDGTFMKKLDTNPYLLCFNNGIVDFKEKVFRNGYPEDNVSRCTNIDFVQHDPSKHSQIIGEITDFFDKLFPEPERRRYFWDHLASTLIGTSANQTFNMYIGAGQNGKSVLVSLMEKVLGEYKGDVPLTLITQQRTKIGGLAPELVQLRGVRYAVIQEPSKGDRINEGIMKQITSGVDPIQARAPYMPEIISFIPQFKLVVCSNTLMKVDSNDHGTWRRIRVVDFESLFTETPISGDRSKPHQFMLDRHIMEKFETWAPILASMLVQRVYETNGVVSDCPLVLASSNSYRASQDYLAEFVSDRIAKHPSECIQKTMLANVFKEWYSTNYGTRIPNIKDIIEHMDKQFGKNRNGTWSGVKIVFDCENVAQATAADDDDFDIDDIDLVEA
jgi:P4 family phage/plasmid primase-like protien